MPVFHVPSVCANANARAVDALERLCEHIDTFRTRPLVGDDFERVERELHEWFVEAEREVLGELLESLDVDVPSVVIGERRLHRVLNSTESYTTAVGPVKVARTLYRSGRERAVAPMELRADIVEGHWTPLAARHASCVVAQMTPSEGEALLRELGNMAPSKSSLDRLPKALSARWEVSREAFESALREAAVVPDEAVTVAVSLDGVMVPMKDGKRADNRERSRAAGRRAKVPAGYQEAGCATLSFYDIEGERLDTLSIARMPGTVDTLEAVVAHAEQAQSLGAAADALRPDAVELPGAMRWVERRVRLVHHVLNIVIGLLPNLLARCVAEVGTVRVRLETDTALRTLRDLLDPQLPVDNRKY